MWITSIWNKLEMTNMVWLYAEEITHITTKDVSRYAKSAGWSRPLKTWIKSATDGLWKDCCMESQKLYC